MDCPDATCRRRLGSPESFRDYDYDPAGDRFLFTRPPRGVAERREIALSLGWAKRLGKKLEAGGAERKR